jgi:hypothetical protein
LNGALLRLAESEFELFLTCDQSIRYQQNLTGMTIPVLELSTNDYRRIRTSIDLIENGIAAILPGSVVKLKIPRCPGGLQGENWQPHSAARIHNPKISCLSRRPVW